MMRVILLDDENASLNELEFYLKKNKNIEIVASFTDPVKALEEIKDLQFDAAFLDIDMPVINGLNVAKELLEKNMSISIIFVTAYNDYAVKAFELNALDYILKPVDKDRLGKAIERLLKKENNSPRVNSTLIGRLNRIEKCIKQDSIKFAASDDEEIILLKLCDILFFEAELKKTIIKTSYGKFKTKETLDSLESKMNEFGFFRSHRSYIVNYRHICKICPMFNNSYVIQMEGIIDQIPVSRKQIRELKELLGIS